MSGHRVVRERGMPVCAGDDVNGSRYKRVMRPKTISTSLGSESFEGQLVAR